MPAEGFHHPKATPRAPSQPPGARTPLAELVAVHDQSILIDASNGGLLDEVSPKVPVELPVFPVAVFRGELPEPPQELVMQHQGSGLQLVNTNSQLGAGVDELAGLQERQENPGEPRRSEGCCSCGNVGLFAVKQSALAGIYSFHSFQLEISQLEIS